MQAARTILRFVFRVLRESERDDCLGMAAEVAFMLMLAFFQALILSVAIFSILGAKPEVFNSIVYFLGSFLPYEIYDIIRNQIIEIAQAKKGGILTLSSIGTIWTMSTLMLTIQKSILRAYHMKETRPFWLVRLISVLLGVLATMLIAVVLSLMFFGLQIARYLENTLGHASDFAFYLRVFRLPGALTSSAILTMLLYLILPNVKQQLYEVVPGALLFTGLWYAFTYGFALYIRNFPLYNTTYGALGGILILMIWMYLTSLSLLIGGEVNAEVHRLRNLIVPRS